jgi:hypothetical protein
MQMSKSWLGALLGVALCLPASGQWRRILISGKGETTDIPLPHPLRYFTANPFLRDDGEDLCGLCTPDDKARSALKYSLRAMVNPVGDLAGYQVVDVLYSGSDRSVQNHDEISWKSILVRIGPDRYREIFHLQASGNMTSLKPSRIIPSGAERVLATMDFDGGVGGGCWEGYWWFNRAGPHSLDFSRLDAAIEKRIPGDTRFNTTCADLDLKSSLVRSGVQKSHPECHACDWVGEVTARFRLSGPIAEPIAIQFKPSQP